MTKHPSDDAPPNRRNSLLPSGEDAKDLVSLGGKSILEFLKVCAGVMLGPAGSGAAGIGGALLGYFAKKWERRATSFSKEVLASSPKIQKLLASEDPTEPLLATFVSVFESCLRDDEDEKVMYYAAFMVGMAEAHLAGELPHLRKVAMLAAIRALRAHDLLLFVALSIAEVIHERMLSVTELESYVRAEMKQLQPDFLMAEQSFASLLSHGVIELDPKVSAAVVMTPNTYGLTKFGEAFWRILKDGIRQALSLNGTSEKPGSAGP